MNTDVHVQASSDSICIIVLENQSAASTPVAYVELALLSPNGELAPSIKVRVHAKPLHIPYSPLLLQLGLGPGTPSDDAQGYLFNLCVHPLHRSSSYMLSNLEVNSLPTEGSE
jgi:hypothetical protein